MVIYECSNCGKQFNRKSNYDYHLYKKKNPCMYVKPQTEETDHNHPPKLRKKYSCFECGKTYTSNSNLKRHVLNNCVSKQTRHTDHVDNPQNSTYLHTGSKTSTQNTHKFQCRYCSIEYSRKDSLKRHIKNNCEIKKQEDAEKNKNYEELVIKIESYEKEIQELKEQINGGDINCHNTTNNTNNTINNNTTNVHNNINLVAFGKEDLSYIPDKAIAGMLSHGLESIILLVREAHYNDEKPHHHNIYISNTRSNDIVIYNGNSWVIKDKKEILEKLYNTKGGYLHGKFGSLKGELDEKTIKKFNNFIKKCDDPEIKKEKLAKIKNLLYNQKKKPIAIRKKMEQEQRKAIKNK